MRSVFVAAFVALCLVGNVAVVSAAEQAIGYQGFPIGQVVPKPRKVQYTDEHVTVWEGAPKACVVVAQDAHPALKLAARELAARPGRIASAVWPGIAGAMPTLEVVSGPAEAAKFPVAIVLAIRSAGGISLPKLVGAEGYAVTWRKDGERRLVYCIGADHRGAYYGAQSLQQLMDTREHRIELRVAEVEDWPVFKIRCSGNDGSIPGAESICERAVEWLPHFKLNGWAVGQSYIWPDNWRETPKDRLEPLKRACAKARETDVIDVIFQIHPFRGRPRDKQFNMVISDPKDLDAFIGLCDEMLTAGAKGINFRADDYHPLSPPDRKRFGDKATAHIHLINEMHKRLKARHPDCYLIFCPPFYHGTPATTRPERRSYMEKLAALPRDIHVMWTGPVTRSLEITHEQIAAYKALIGRDPFLWDNTVYAHRGRYGYSTRHPGYLFDTFQTDYPDDYGVTCPGIRYNWGYGDRTTSKVGNINIADYMWNPAGYEPEASLRQALAIQAGARAVDDLLALREAYYEIKDAQDAGKSGELAVFERMQQAAADLPALVERIRTASASADVAKLVAGRQRAALATFERSSGAMMQILAARKTRLVDFDLSQATWREEVKGKWTVARDGGSVQFSFPNGTRSFGGAFGRLAADIAVPASPTGRYYLLFSAYDDYTSMGTPSSAWPGYLCKQVLVGDEVVWEDDVEGREPPGQEAMQIVDVTERLRGKEKATVAFRGFDKRGVGNMGAKIRFANACLVAGPCKLLASAVEVPDCPALRSLESFTMVVGFTPRQVGKRSPLYARQKPMQYFAYIHESGHAAAGVFTGGAEAGVTTKRKVTPGTRHTLAFIFDQGLIKLFLDGALEAERRIEDDVDPGNGQLTIGSYSSESTYFDGVIHEVRLFSRALSQDELAPGQAETKAPAARDIAVNGQCEELDKEGKPLGWRCRGEKAEWGASDQAHAGKRSVVVRAPAGKGEVALVHGTGEGYAAPPRTVHRVSVWAKGDAGRIVIEPRGDAGTLGTFPVWVGGEWKRFEGTFVTRADTRRFVLAFRVPRAAEGDAPRTLYVDDLTLEQLPPALAGWWKLDDPNAVVARDLTGACPDGAIYRRWRVGAP